MSKNVEAKEILLGLVKWAGGAGLLAAGARALMHYWFVSKPRLGGAAEKLEVFPDWAAPEASIEPLESHVLVFVYVVNQGTTSTTVQCWSLEVKAKTDILVDAEPVKNAIGWDRAQRQTSEGQLPDVQFEKNRGVRGWLFFRLPKTRNELAGCQARVIALGADGKTHRLDPFTLNPSKI